MDENERRIQKLEQQVSELMKWKLERIRQQFVYPIDDESVKILQNYFMRITSIANYSFIGAEEHSTTEYIGFQNNLMFNVAKNTLFNYTVNVSSNVFTLQGGAPGYENDAALIFYHEPGGTIPAPLVDNTTYYVVSSDGITFKVSATVGGAAVNITDDGDLRQFVARVL